MVALAVDAREIRRLNVLPVASLVAVTVTPGRTAPVESVTVPVSVASCAEAIAGSSRNIPTIKNRLAKFIAFPPWDLSCRRNDTKRYEAGTAL